MDKDETKKVKISVIVPAYKTYEYISKCLDSILNQTLKDIEIIVINDGSPDDCESIILDYAGRDDRLKYYRQENVGLGMTRNKGIEKASGEYLAFVDSDDFIEPDMMLRMYEKAVSREFDVVVCETYMNEKEKQYLRSSLSGTDDIDLMNCNTRDFLRNILFTNKYRYCAWDKIYKTSFIRKNKIAFGDNREVYAEDAFFQFHVIKNKPLMGFLSKPLYHYVQREGSITGSIRDSYMKRHLCLQNMLYENSVQELMPMVDVMLFRGLLNEAAYSVRYRIRYRKFRESISRFYSDKSFDWFMDSVKKNRTRKLISGFKRRLLFGLFVFLLSVRAFNTASLLIYFTKI